MESSTLRLVWHAIEETQNHDLLHVTDTVLVKQLVQKVANKVLLDTEEVRAVTHYLASRTALIRDLTDPRI
jgi:hypothetical protein